MDVQGTRRAERARLWTELDHHTQVVGERVDHKASASANISAALRDLGAGIDPVGLWRRTKALAAESRYGQWLGAHLPRPVALSLLAVAQNAWDTYPGYARAAKNVLDAAAHGSLVALEAGRRLLGRGAALTPAEGAPTPPVEDTRSAPLEAGPSGPPTA